MMPSKQFHDFDAEILYAIGESIGDAFQYAFQKNTLESVIKKIESLWPVSLNEPLYFLYISHGYDDFGNRSSQKEDDLYPEDLAHRFLDAIKYDEYYTENLNKTLEDFASIAFDNDWSNYIRFETEEQKKERISEEERKSLEIVAANFGKKCKHKPGTIEFIQALYDAIQRNEYDHENYNSMERKMEEWMDHRYAGATEYYFENREFTNSRINEERQTLDDVWTWLEENCPLLICKFQEQMETC